MSSRPTVLITDAHRGSAISFIRSLGRRGYRVIAADSVPRSAGFLSRFSDRSIVYPSPENAADEYVKAILKTVREEAVDLIVPITDLTLVPLVEARDRIAPTCQLAAPTSEALEATRNKELTFQIAQQLEIPCPRSFAVHNSSEAIEAARELKWPVVVKPKQSRRFAGGVVESLQVAYANDVNELVAALGKIHDRPVLLQEYVSGVGVGLELLMHEGQPLAAFQHRRLREMPVTGGPSSLRESERIDPILYTYSTRLLQSIGWTGLAMVEFKKGVDGPRLMEVNGRVWGSMPLALHSGMDFPNLLADLYLQGPPSRATAVDTRYTVGVRARNLQLDLKWIASVLTGMKQHPFLPTPRRGQALMALCQLLHPRYRFDVFSWRDPAPAIAATADTCRMLYQKCFKRGASENDSLAGGDVCLRSH